MNLLDILDATPSGEHSVVIYPNRHALRQDFQPYLGKRSQAFRTHALHHAEYIEDRKRLARVYLRTPRQITYTNHNHAIDGSVHAYVADGVEVTDLMKTRLEESGITNITQVGKQQ
jgi:hypothetical protein|nr:MAG TPA: hypothetical protein [Caudoviricetes sp.]